MQMSICRKRHWFLFTTLLKCLCESVILSRYTWYFGNDPPARHPGARVLTHKFLAWVFIPELDLEYLSCDTSEPACSWYPYLTHYIVNIAKLCISCEISVCSKNAIISVPILCFPLALRVEPRAFALSYVSSAAYFSSWDGMTQSQ